MTEKANDVLEKARSRNERVQDYLRPAADFFHRNEGTMFGRNEAREKIGKELDVNKDTAGAVIAQLISDKVDPIVQVSTDDEKFVGVVGARIDAHRDCDRRDTRKWNNDWWQHFIPCR